LADFLPMIYPYKSSPVSCMQSAGQGKFAGQRSAFHRAATKRFRNIFVALRGIQGNDIVM